MIYKRPSSIHTLVDDYVKLYGNENSAKQHFFNLGAGSWMHPCWTNVDLPAQTPEFAAIQAPCLKHDFVKDKVFPIDSDSVDAFYCSHVVEHIPADADLNMFKEAYRCLRQGGTFRISTGPCADLDWSALMRQDINWWYFYDDKDFIDSIMKDKPQMTLFDKWLYHVATPKSVYSKANSNVKYTSTEIEELVKTHSESKEVLLDMLTNDIQFDIKFPGNHISWWNFERLEKYLKMAGFSVVYKSGYGQSGCNWMRDLDYFDQTYPQISVYVEAVK